MLPATDNPQPSLGFWRATSLVTGNIIGAGLFMLPASLGAYGSLGLLGMLLTSIGSMCLAFVFAKLSRDRPMIGGPYAYGRDAFGDFIGFQMAWSYWIGTWASVAALAVTFVSYLSVFWHGLDTNLELSLIISFITVWILTFLNLAGMKMASTAQVITTILKIIPLLIIGICGIPYMNFDHFMPINPSDIPFWPALFASAALTLFSFVGLESATIPAEDVEDPHTTIPKATIYGTLFAAFIYLGIMIVILGLLPAEQLAKSPAPFVEAGAIIFGSWAGPLIAIAAIVSTLGTLNGLMIVQGQIPVAAARDSLFPLFFDKHNKKGSPYMALIVSSVLMCFLLLLNYKSSLVEQFNTIVIFVTFTVILTYVYTALADLYFIWCQPNQLTLRQRIQSSIVGFIAFVFTLIITVGAGQKAVYLGMLLVFSGFPFYVWMKHQAKAS